jgi:hypothetical protein
MDWIKKELDVTNDNLEVIRSQQDEEFLIENFKVEKTVETISNVGQLLIANHVLYEISGLMTAIPITDNEIEQVAINEVATHFNKVQKIYVNQQLNRIQCRELKERSKRMFNEQLKEKRIHPFVKELYFLKEKDSFEDRYINISNCEKVRYKVLKQNVPPSSIKAPTDIINFIKDSFCQKQNHFTVLPIGWELSNELLELESMRLLSEVSDTLFLQVDPNSNKVLYMEFDIK